MNRIIWPEPFNLSALHDSQGRKIQPVLDLTQKRDHSFSQFRKNVLSYPLSLLFLASFFTCP